MNVFIHSLVDGLLGRFWFEAITNTVALSILELSFSVHMYASFSLVFAQKQN